MVNITIHHRKGHGEHHDAITIVLIVDGCFAFHSQRHEFALSE